MQRSKVEKTESFFKFFQNPVMYDDEDEEEDEEVFILVHVCVCVCVCV